MRNAMIKSSRVERCNLLPYTAEPNLVYIAAETMEGRLI